MNYDNGGLSASDVALLTGNRNDGGFGDNSGWWIILLLLALGGFGGYGGFGGFNGGFGGMYEFPWILTGQQGINNNTNNGFDNLQLSNQITGIDNSIDTLSAQVCSGFANTNQTINAGFANAETSANARQMANMQQAFNSEITTLNGFNNLNNALQQCCCDNRLATCQTQNIVQNEGNATRFADANNTRDIITNATSNTQAILDKLCQLELDGVKAQVEAKNDRIAELQTQLNMANLSASQTAQNAFIAQGFANEVDQLYNRLNNCPINTVPVFRKNTDFHL